MKPGTSNTGCPSPCGASISNGNDAGSNAISMKMRDSSSELHALGGPIWPWRTTGLRDMDQAPPKRQLAPCLPCSLEGKVPKKLSLAV